MMVDSFSAFVMDEVGGKPVGGFRTMTLADLPDNDVLVEVAFSTLNYKDGLATSGRQKIARKPPLVGGIDLAGIIVESRNPAWQAGDKVVVNGWGLSETQNGGYTRFQRLKSEWLIRLPEGLTLEQSMAIGTAGYTAALCVDVLERWGRIRPGAGEVLVTGAAGGVGSVAISLLAQAGYQVAASTGRPQEESYLRSLGASSIIDRNELSAKSPPLQKERWTGAIDSVGGITLANVLSQLVYRGAAAACGLAGGADLPATVLPHILRGVALLGVDSVMAPNELRQAAWSRLVRDLDRGKLQRMTRTEPMSRLPELAEELLAGRIAGRIVIDVTK